MCQGAPEPYVIAPRPEDHPSGLQLIEGVSAFPNPLSDIFSGTPAPGRRK